MILTVAAMIVGQTAVCEAVAAPADDGTVLKGIVIDSETGEPLIGAAIMVSNTTEGVITDLDGAFAINLLRESTPLEVSYIGYKTVPFEVVAASGRIGLNAGQEHDNYNPPSGRRSAGKCGCDGTEDPRIPAGVEEREDYFRIRYRKHRS